MIIAAWRKRGGTWTRIHRVRVERAEKIWGARTACARVRVPERGEVAEHIAANATKWRTNGMKLEYCATCFDWLRKD